MLSRLNRYAEMEANGELSPSMIPIHELLDWKDHNPEQNLTADEGPEEPQFPTTGPEASAASPAPLPAPLSQPPASAPTRVKARASRAGHTKEGRSAPNRRREANEADEEPDTAPPRGGLRLHRQALTLLEEQRRRRLRAARKRALGQLPPAHAAGPAVAPHHTCTNASPPWAPPAHSRDCASPR
ncbi:hypothetical protein [Deinococcus multiflagellatus]|uniref:Uncharacterized protein n=1 Tax=Deinococcus multiflagellatus TaxID=1656887 RepID=A0ABW1ZS43_9DEIO